MRQRQLHILLSAIIAIMLGFGICQAQSQQTYVAIDMITSDVSPQALGQEKPQLVGNSPLILTKGAVGGWFVRAMTRDATSGAQLGRTVDISTPPNPCLPPNPCDLIYSAHFMPGQVIVLGDDGAMVSFPITIQPDGTPEAGPSVCHPPEPGLADFGPACAITELPGSVFRDGMPRLYVGTQSGMIARFSMPVTGEIVLDEVIDLLAGKPIADLEPIPQTTGVLLGIGTGLDIYGLIDIDAGPARAVPAIQFVAFNPDGTPVRCFSVEKDPGPTQSPVHIVFGDGRHGRIPRASIPADASGTFALTMVPPNPVWPLLSGPVKDLALGSLLVLQEDGQKVYYDPGFDPEFGATFCVADMDLPEACSIIECPFVLTGDVNQTGTLTSADIIFLVGFIFKGGAEPLPCQGAGDVNCTNNVNSADVIYLVNHVFKGGPPPCDQCTNSWVCW